MISIRPAILTRANPSVTCWSSISNPRDFSASTMAKANAQLMAWCAPNSGTCKCSNLLVGVVRHKRVCRPMPRDASKRVVKVNSSPVNLSDAPTSCATSRRTSLTSDGCGALIAGTQEVLDDVYACCEIGIDQLTFDFRTNSLDDSIRVMEHLADRVLPVAQRLG